MYKAQIRGPCGGGMLQVVRHSGSTPLIQHVFGFWVLARLDETLTGSLDLWIINDWYRLDCHSVQLIEIRIYGPASGSGILPICKT